eukprot:jgi/Botrbrau1/934/Bobra.0167s0045.1
MAKNKFVSRSSARFAALLLFAVFLDSFTVIQGAQGPTKAPTAPARAPVAAPRTSNSTVIRNRTAAVVPAAGAPHSGPAASPSQANGRLLDQFVQRAGTRFVIAARDGDPDSCETFYFSGANANYLMVRAANPKTRPQVLEILDSAKELGLTVLRIWAFSDGHLEWNSLQRYPGVYDEATFQGLDFVLDQASRRGIRITLVLANYWAMYGGLDMYNMWSFQAGAGQCPGDGACRDAFFSDPVAVGFYRNHVKAILTRNNTYNGRIYKDDPTIFSYNLMNEPRSQQELYVVRRKTTDSGKIYNISYNPADDLQNWIKDTAAYIKSMDPVHLLTTGMEGFAGNSTPLYLYSNPGAWASLMGNDFVRNHKVEGIDYATMHVYVDQWLCVEQGSTEDGQLGFLKNWIEVRQQAAEEDLQMPVVLEEFGAKMDKRAPQYKVAYDSCLASAKRGGACAGVMFWDLVHQGYGLVDPWLDGALRFGGGYSNWLPAKNDDMSAVLALVKGYSSAVAKLNAASGSPATCVFVPPRQMGDGCGGISINLDEGGMPWTCLAGEPENMNWCNAEDSMLRYHNPPDAWKGARDKGLPYNSIEVLVLGNITNTGSQPVNLKGAWFIVPFSQGVHTEYEGVWKRAENPNSFFQVFCWFMGKSSSGENLCQDGSIHINFTTFNWPIGTKMDRGLNISFQGDVTLYPQESITGSAGSNDVMISFKDAKKINPYRLDVSSLGIPGSSDCPASPGHIQYPPPPPPPCSEGKHPWRGCPRLEWLRQAHTTASTPAAITPPTTVPVQVGTISTSSVPNTDVSSAGRRLIETDESPSTSSAPASNAPASGLVRPQSVSAPVAPTGIIPGRQLIVVAYVKADGDLRKPPLVLPGPAGLLPRPDIGGSAKAKQVDVMVTMKYMRSDLNAATYKVLAKGLIVPNTGFMMVKGVVDFPDDIGENARVYAEIPVPNLAVTLDRFAVYDPTSISALATLPANITDVYQPCVLHPDLAPSAVYEVSLPPNTTSDTLSIELCSPGGYDQVLRVYSNGKEVVRTDPPGKDPYYTFNMPVRAGRKYLLVLDGDVGFPYGGYRGHPGLRLKWMSGAPFLGTFDAAPLNNGTGFVRVVNGRLSLNCKSASYVGCNTWDLMDKARYPEFHEEIMNRLDSMVKVGMHVGRIWGFSLGSGTGVGPMGQTVMDKTQILETAPGQYNEEVWKALDWVLDEAGKRDVRLIIPVEDYWLSIDRFVNWSSTAVGKNDFYTDWQARQMYKAHLLAFTSRVNSINGKTYRDDPTIYAWNLINEPRCTGCGYQLQAWIEEMALYLKAIDPNHIVSIGAEGFYSTTCDRVYLNPGAGKRRTGIDSSPWAAQEGQDFLANAIVPSVDLATSHVWADNWLGYADYTTNRWNDNFDYTYGDDLWKEKLDYTRRWLIAHIEDAQKLGKPLILEEFGKAVSAAKVFSGLVQHAPEEGETMEKTHFIRDLLFQQVYELMSKSALNNGAAQGSNFWNLYSSGVAQDDPFQVTLDDSSTMGIIAAHMKNISQVVGQDVC